jgi:hypothetical protein
LKNDHLVIFQFDCDFRIRTCGFCKAKVSQVGVAIEAKKCLHFFVNERRRL